MMTTKEILFIGFFALLLQFSTQLPVKESSSTEKAKTEESDSPTQNLENIIGKVFKTDIVVIMFLYVLYLRI